MSGRRIWAVIPVFHPQMETIAEIVRSLEDGVGGVVIVDDGSGSAEIALPATDFIRLARNQGIAAAINVGVARAREKGASHVLLLDQDSIPQPGMLAALSSVLAAQEQRGHRVAAVGSRFLDPYTGLQSSFTRLARLGVRRVACHPAAHEVQTDFLISSGSLIPLVAFDEIGPMEESLFIDQVDAEWCLRARSKDYRLFGACRAVLRHSLGEGATRVWFGRWRHVHPHKAFRYYYIFRKTGLLTRRPYVPVAWTLHGLWYLAGLLVVAGIMAKERSSVLPRMLKGVLDGVRGVTGRIVES